MRNSPAQQYNNTIINSMENGLIPIEYGLISILFKNKLSTPYKIKSYHRNLIRSISACTFHITTKDGLISIENGLISIEDGLTFKGERPNFNRERPNFNRERPNFNRERPNFNTFQKPD